MVGDGQMANLVRQCLFYEIVGRVLAVREMAVAM